MSPRAGHPRAREIYRRALRQPVEDHQADLARGRRGAFRRRIRRVQGSVGVLLQPLIPLVRNAGATLHWAVDDPRSLETWAPGLELLTAVRTLELPGLDRLVLPARLGAWALSFVPLVRDVGRLLRYRF